MEREADERFYDAFERAVGILERANRKAKNGDGTVAVEKEEQENAVVNGSGDLIKKKREFGSFYKCR